MKKLILIAGATAVVVGGGVAAANHYEQHKDKKQAALVSEIVQAREEQYKADVVKLTALIKANETLNAECQKGALAHARLPFALQRVVPKPACATTQATL